MELHQNLIKYQTTSSVISYDVYGYGSYILIHHATDNYAAYYYLFIVSFILIVYCNHVMCLCHTTMISSVQTGTMRVINSSQNVTALPSGMFSWTVLCVLFSTVLPSSNFYARPDRFAQRI